MPRFVARRRVGSQLALLTLVASLVGCADHGAPGAPVAVDALGGDGRITLRWAPVDGATSYVLYFAEAVGVTRAGWASLPGGGRIAGATSPYVHGGLVNGRTYSYVVVAANHGTEGAESLEVAAQPTAVGWDWLQPSPGGDGLNAVRFLDSDEGWAVGPVGTILHTRDGGATWTRRASATTSALWDVDFVDPSTGWAVGGFRNAGDSPATILHTTDGGATWRSQGNGGWGILHGVEFVDGTTGWAVGHSGILHTVDGGRTWRPQPNPTQIDLWKVRFMTASTGWVAGGHEFGTSQPDGVVLRTTDAGATWAASPLPHTRILDLAFVDSKRGFAVDNGTGGRILGTNDGGATWGTVPTGGGPALHAIAFADASAGWAVGRDGVVVRTTDGGASWSGPTPLAPATTLSGLAVRSPDELVAVGTPFAILRSRDRGATWAGADARTLPRFLPSSLVFVDAAHGYASGYRSGDGGVTWTPHPVPSGWVDFVSASAAWSVEQIGCVRTPGLPVRCYPVARTLDGGTTWEHRGFILNTTGSGIFGVDFVDEQRGFAVGDGGLIRATMDGGTTWVTQPSGTTERLTAVKAVSATTAWAVGLGGIVLKTLDGGARWSGQMSGTTRDLSAVAALDESRAWATGGDGIIATTDGGSTWTTQFRLGYGSLTDIHFASAAAGWAVGIAGVILGTADGGVTWELQSCPTAQDLARVVAANDAVAWIATAGGDLLGTTSGGR